MEIKKPLELVKSKYIKRWKGPDGKWRYKYKADGKVTRDNKAMQYSRLLDIISDEGEDGASVLEEFLRRDMPGEQGENLVRRAISASRKSGTISSSEAKHLLETVEDASIDRGGEEMHLSSLRDTIADEGFEAGYAIKEFISKYPKASVKVSDAIDSAYRRGKIDVTDRKKLMSTLNKL